MDHPSQPTDPSASEPLRGDRHIHAAGRLFGFAYDLDLRIMHLDGSSIESVRPPLLLRSAQPPLNAALEEGALEARSAAGPGERRR